LSIPIIPIEGLTTPSSAAFPSSLSSESKEGKEERAGLRIGLRVGPWVGLRVGFGLGQGLNRQGHESDK